MTAKAFRMILGLDPHQDSAELLQAAAPFASRLNARVDVVEVHEFLSPDPLATGWAGGPGVGLPPGAPPQDPGADEVAGDELRRTGGAAGAFGDNAWEAPVTRGAAAVRLTTLAEEMDADLIAIGAPSTGWSEWLHHLLSGSVAHELERISPVPVLLLPSAAQGEDSNRRKAGHAATA